MEMQINVYIGVETVERVERIKVGGNAERE
jgi:hypothetical protein